MDPLASLEGAKNFAPTRIRTLNCPNHIESLYRLPTMTRKVKLITTGKGKRKGHPRTGHEGPEEEQMYRSTLPSTLALDVVGGQNNATAALIPGNTRYPSYMRLGGPQGRSSRVRKISPPTGIRSPDRPARSESLYRLSYPGPYNLSNTKSNIS